MSSTVYYDIHGLIRLRVTGDAALLTEVNHHLEAFITSAPGIADPDIEIGPFSEAPVAPREVVVDDYSYGDGLYYHAGRRVAFDLDSTPIRMFADRLALPINLLVQLALMRHHLTFVHGAGLEINGEAVLFPAYPGTGKTTIVSGMVRLGAKFYGDDLCVIGGGQIGSFPQALSVYEHHLPILQYEDAAARKAFARTKRIDRLIGLIGSGRTVPQRIGRFVLSALRTPSVNVPPTRIFGLDAIAGRAPLRRVISLQRSAEVDRLTAAETTAADLARHATTVLWHEWHGSFHDLLLYDALAHGGGGMPRWFATVERVLIESFEQTHVGTILIPGSWDNRTLVREFPAFWREFRN